MSADGRYWSIEECGWKASPGRGDALVTPWSAHGVTPGVPAGPNALDAADVLRSRRGDTGLPAQRGLATSEEPSRPRT